MKENPLPEYDFPQIVPGKADSQPSMERARSLLSKAIQYQKKRDFEKAVLLFEEAVSESVDILADTYPELSSRVIQKYFFLLKFRILNI